MRFIALLSLMVVVALATGGVLARGAAAATTAAAAAKAPAAKAPTAKAPAATAAKATANVLAGVGAVEPLDASFRINEIPGAVSRGPWTLFAEGFVRYIREGTRVANARNKVLRDQPVPAVPENTIPANPVTGKCVPFQPPAPYKSLQDYCRAMTKMPWKEAKAMFVNAKAPTDWVGIRGCAVGCVMGDNLWSQVVTSTLGVNWSGKCIREDETGKQLEVFQAMCPSCGGINSKRPWSAGVPADLEIAGVTVVRETSSWIDGQPTWVFNYDKAQRTYGVDFDAFRDEVRMVAPGMAVGSMLLQGSNATYQNGWNPGNSTLEVVRFLLLQTCAKNGEYPTRPIDRVVP